MGRDCQPRLSFNPPLTQIHILLRTAIDNLDVHPLVCARANIGSDDDELVFVCRIPDALGRGILGGWKIEFDGKGGGEESECEESEECRK